MEQFTAQQPQHKEGAYNIIVLGLVVLIIASLAALWMMERNKRIAAEKRQGGMSGLESLLKSGAATTLPPQLAMPGGEQASGLARKDILDMAQTVVIRGQSRKVITITTSAGRRLGLEPGDVIEVAETPASRPVEPVESPGQ